MQDLYIIKPDGTLCHAPLREVSNATEILRGIARAEPVVFDDFPSPGYRFKAVDVLMTNFHLPKSTLFMLVSAFCGLDCMKDAYAHAIAHDYRFYSYGDASLLFPARGESAGERA